MPTKRRPRRGAGGRRSKGFEVWRKVPAFERSQDHAQGRRPAARARRRHRALMTHGAGQAAGRGQGRDHHGLPTSSTGSPKKAAAPTAASWRRARPACYQLVIKEPVGPVAAFTPWNFPINQIVRKLSAALAAGCSIIVKAPEETPASPAELIRAFADAGVPAGVVNLVYGDPAEISQLPDPAPGDPQDLVHRLDRGRQAARRAGRPAHEARDHGARRPRAGDRLRRRRHRRRPPRSPAAAKFRNAGQVCISPTRFLVHEDVRKAFVDAFVAAAKGAQGRQRPGRAARSWARWPTRAALSAMEDHVDDARDAAAPRWPPAATASASAGNFFEPTVLTDAPLDAAC